MQRDLVEKLRCPGCLQSTNLILEGIEEIPQQPDFINEGLLVWPECRSWYPIDGGVLELLPQDVCYRQDREDFINRHRSLISGLGLDCRIADAASISDPRIQQQSHFDWYAQNALQTYEEYEKSNFWKASDKLIIQTWSERIFRNSWLVDVGC